MLGPVSTRGVLRQLIADSLRSLPLSAGTRLFLSSGEEVGVRRWEQSPTSALVERAEEARASAAGTRGYRPPAAGPGDLVTLLRVKD